MFNNFYKNKKVLITGHTGFKGTWMTCWLLELGAKVIGVSDSIPTTPSMFIELNLKDRISHNLFDIRDYNKISTLIKNEQPDVIFHLAAQAIVSESFNDPLNTISTNVIGTVNILESLKQIEYEIKCILITSDKSYYNVEWPWGYKETDRLGGKDIYSGSKAAADILIESYFHTYLKNKSNVKIAVGRAGNVIGGGDWAKDRIVVDCIIAWSENKKVEIRSPFATRPWQHVLEPISGYLTLGSQLNESINGAAFNFGPNSSMSKSVLDLIKSLGGNWKKNDSELYTVSKNSTPFIESKLLKLNCDKALFYLKWESTLNFEFTYNFVSDWYHKYYHDKIKMHEFTVSQINQFSSLATDKKLKWTS